MGVGRRIALAALLYTAAPCAVAGFLAGPVRCHSRPSPPTGLTIRMMSKSKLRGYYTVSEGNGGGWNLYQEAVEGAVFLGNRGARRRFTAGFSSQGPALASPLRVSDRKKILNYKSDLEAEHARLKREVESLERLGVYATHSCDVKLKALKKKKLATKDRLAAIDKMLDREQLARDPETAQTQNPKRLGQGACGSVVLGRDVSTGQEVMLSALPAPRTKGWSVVHARVNSSLHRLPYIRVSTYTCGHKTCAQMCMRSRDVHAARTRTHTDTDTCAHTNARTHASPRWRSSLNQLEKGRARA